MKLLGLVFPSKSEGIKVSAFLLAARIIFGLLLVNHGFQKLTGFYSMLDTFPDPLGLGGEMSLALAIFGELFCGMAFIFGFLTRFALIPMITTMMVAFFIVHNGSVAEGELAFVYLIVFVLMWFAGAGRFSVDAFVGSKLAKQCSKASLNE